MSIITKDIQEQETKIIKLTCKLFNIREELKKSLLSEKDDPQDEKILAYKILDIDKSLDKIQEELEKIINKIN